MELPGVGRKTANVVLGHALGVPGLPVDRHVLRVANRIGLVRFGRSRKSSNRSSARSCPPDRWTRASDVLILHGRRICRPKPLCDRCNVRAWCAYFKALGSKGARSARFDARRPGRGRVDGRDARTVQAARRRGARDDSGGFSRRDAEHRDRDRRRTDSRTARRRRHRSRRIRCWVSTRAFRSPSGNGRTATRCPTRSRSSRDRSKTRATTKTMPSWPLARR